MYPYIQDILVLNILVGREDCKSTTAVVQYLHGPLCIIIDLSLIG
jgi:hypothetical protein